MAIFYRGGFQCQLLLNGTGYGTKEKWTLLEKQIRRDLGNKGFLDKFVDLQFQVYTSSLCKKNDRLLHLLTASSVGVPEPNPSSQLASTTYCRIFAEALHEKTIMSVLGSFSDLALRHFSGKQHHEYCLPSDRPRIDHSVRSPLYTGLQDCVSYTIPVLLPCYLPPRQTCGEFRHARQVQQRK